MRQVGSITPVPEIRQKSAAASTVGKRPAAQFAQIKEAWTIQVASDRKISETALRIALVWPVWLNAKSLTAWPAQSTIAATINSSVRSVRDGLKKLISRGHMVCLTEKPSGRTSNVYRIVLNDTVITEQDVYPGKQVPGSEEQAFRAERNRPSSHTGQAMPNSAEAGFRGTPERTPEKAREGPPVWPSVKEAATRGPRVSNDARKSILRDVFGTAVVSEKGHLHRDG